MTPITRNRAKKGGLTLRMLLGYTVTFCTLALCTVQGAAAFELSLPSNAQQTHHETAAPASYAYPTGNQSSSGIPMDRAEGRVSRTSWRVRSDGLETLQLMAPLAAQLEAEGFTALHRCAAERCGGYDFRFAMDVIAAPDMFVDLFDYRYAAYRRPIRSQAPASPQPAKPEQEQAGTAAATATATQRPKVRPSEGEETILLLVSRAGASGYVHMVQIAPIGSPAAQAAKAGVPPVALDGPAAQPAGQGPALQETETLPEALRNAGHVVLDDLSFGTGSATLGPGPFASLAALADLLLGDATLRVALVGHTDSVGGLETNIGLSKRRAASVVERLVAAYGVPRGQLDGEGVGYLSPRNANLTEAGREANRRVEAVLLNAE